MQLDIKGKKETACSVLFLGIYLKFDTNVTIVNSHLSVLLVSILLLSRIFLLGLELF